MQVFSVILIIGILIFVHELGHFLAAKSLKIPVKIFSIGFPLGNLPPLIKFQWNETECQLNLLPLGGFCAFMDDDKEMELVENDQRLLNNRKVWERFVVLSGGVFFNFIFAVFVAIVMFFSLGIPEGREFSDGVQVLDVKGGSPAEKAGLKPLDTIIAVDNVPLTFENDINQTLDSILKMTPAAKDAQLAYLDQNNERVEKKVTLTSQNTLGYKTEEIRGISVMNVLSGYTGEKAGLIKGDIITEIGGKDFKGSRNPEGLMKDVLSKYSNGKPLELAVLRKGKTERVKATVGNDNKLGIGIEYIKGLLIVNADNAVDKSIVPLNSVIIEVNTNPLYDTSSMMKRLIASHKNGSTAKIVVKRQDKEKNIDVIPDNTGVMGVQIQSAIKEVTRPPLNALEPFVYAGSFIKRTTILLSGALLKMFSGNLSLNEVGGPIMVVAKGSEIAQADFTKLFHFTILISIELVILNLLPLPAVDGGHLFLLIIEKIRGRRLPKAFEERIHYAGLMVLLGLGVVLIFKDVLTLSKIIR
ncbi:MAG: RIP metalloprotease RseP [Candidatus Sericytochromatia bacterium]|nr:RIP metalloprotease RseP [Candidatus Sericytochromatia bacterium]